MSPKEFYENKVKPGVKKGCEKAKKTGKIVVETFKKNPMLAFMAVGSVVSTIGKVASDIAERKEDEQKRCTTYDAYAGADLVTTHELTNSEVLEMTERMKSGQKKVEALNDMGLLKEDKRR